MERTREKRLALKDIIGGPGTSLIELYFHLSAPTLMEQLRTVNDGASEDNSHSVTELKAKPSAVMMLRSIVVGMVVEGAAEWNGVQSQGEDVFLLVIPPLRALLLPPMMKVRM